LVAKGKKEASVLVHACNPSYSSWFEARLGRKFVSHIPSRQKLGVVVHAYVGGVGRRIMV
jgi:hypothetical protein